MMKWEWRVTSAESGISLLNFIKEKLNHRHSGKKIKKFIEAGACTHNQRVERFSSKQVGAGDRVIFEEIGVEKSPEVNVEIKRVLYNDGSVLAYDKPPGIASDDKEWTKDLEKLVKSPLSLLHRLDKETSGVLLFSMNDTSSQELLRQFKQREIHKCYIALVDGVIEQEKGIVENSLGKLAMYHGQTLWGAVSGTKGLHAKTRWKVKTRGKGATLVECYPETGRTHQIRVHLAGLGHPILGDHQYGKKFKSGYKAPRILLHAIHIEFNHPNSGQLVMIQAPVPEDFNEALRQVL